MDLIDKIYLSSYQGHYFILVAFDYFMKWIEAIMFKDVKQLNIIEFIEHHIICHVDLQKTNYRSSNSLYWLKNLS